MDFVCLSMCWPEYFFCVLNWPLFNQRTASTFNQIRIREHYKNEMNTWNQLLHLVPLVRKVLMGEFQLVPVEMSLSGRNIHGSIYFLIPGLFQKLLTGSGAVIRKWRSVSSGESLKSLFLESSCLLPVFCFFSLPIFRQMLCSSLVHFRYQPDTVLSCSPSLLQWSTPWLCSLSSHRADTVSLPTVMDSTKSFCVFFCNWSSRF